MMRRILTLLTLFLLPLPASLLSLRAQQVWTAGTVWEVNREEPYISSSGEIKTTLRTFVYTLEEAVDIEGTPYFPLTKFESGLDSAYTVAYIRAERGDSLVYVRLAKGVAAGNRANSFGAGDEMLLYDFTKRFEYGDVITYGTELGPQTTKVDRQYGTLDYYYDVIEEGDCLPAWGSLIYKIGAFDGPLGLFFSEVMGGLDPDEKPEPTDGESDKPKSSNVSHTLFKRKGGGGCVIVPTPDGIRVVEFTDDSSVCFDLSGRVYPERQSKDAHNSAPHSFYIYKGRKHIK